MRTRTLVSAVLAAAAAAHAATAGAGSSSTTATPSAWISVNPSDGSASTVTPSVLTNSAGSATKTLDAKPATTTATAKSSASASPLVNGKEVYTDCDSSKYSVAPFCAPADNASWWISGTYYVTWDSSLYDKNSSIVITLDYDVAGGNGKVAYTTTTTNAIGFTTINLKKECGDCLLNQTALDAGDKQKLDNQTMTLNIASNDPTADRNVLAGPSVLLTKSPTPAKVDTSPSNRPPVSVVGLAVGLPVAIAFIIGSVCCLHLCMRSQRKVGPITIGGGARRFRRRGYSGRAERRAKFAAAPEQTYHDLPEEEERVLPSHQDADWELASVHGQAR